VISPGQAEKLAHALVENYINKCGCENTQDVANALMKLASMCGLGMCAVVGRAESVQRLRETADYIAKAQAGVNWKVETPKTGFIQ
jgi:hypothetical protein